MTRHTRQRLPALLISLGVLIGLAACAETKPSQFYVLSSLEAPATEATAGDQKKQPVSVGVGPINLPEYLDRPQIVTRTSPTKLSLAEFDRWGEPLRPLLTRVMVENLSVLLASERVYGMPRRGGGRLDYRVEIDVFRFDADQTGRVLLNARWTLYGASGQRPLRIGKAVLSDNAGSATDKEALAGAMSRIVERLSREIAREIKARRT